MAFVVSAITGSTFIAAATIGTVGALAYQDKQRKAMHSQQDAVKAQQQRDVLEKARLEAEAQQGANATVMATRKRRKDSALALGDPTTGTLGGTSTLGAGSNTPTVATRPAGTALGAGGQ